MAVDLPASEEEAVPSTRCSSEESEAREKSVEEINEVPVYQHNHLLNGKFTVVERVGFNDRVGGTYWAVHDDKEMIIRVDKKGGCAVKNEANFLIKMEKANRWRLFSQVHSTWEDAEGRFHLALFFRPGPTLKQCQEFFGRPFSLGTAGRSTEDLFAVVEAVHALSFLLRCINADMLHFDANSRHLFLADVSTVRVDPAKANLDVTTSWEGGSLFGPLSADKGEPLTAAGDLEAALFFAISLVVDALPWQDCYAETVGHHKEQAIADGTLFGPLPLEFREAHALIADHEEALDETVYERLRGLAKNIYEGAGIKDLDENFDFEREPAEDELPRFVLEKKPRGEDATGDLVVDDDGIPTLPLS